MMIVGDECAQLPHHEHKMATSMILQSLPVALSSLYLELNILPKYLQQLLDTSTSSAAGAGETTILSCLPKAYGGVILVNVICSGLYLVILGMKVGGARQRFTDKVIPPSCSSPDLPLLLILAIRRSKMEKKMLRNDIRYRTCMLMATQRMPDSSIVCKEVTNKLLKPILNSLP